MRDGPIGRGMQKALTDLIMRYGTEGMIRLYNEDGIYNCYLKMEKPDAEEAPPAANAVGGGRPGNSGQAARL